MTASRLTLGLVFTGLALLMGACSDGSDRRAAPDTLAQGALAAGIEFGAAIDWDLSEPRRRILAREFTSATVENSLKWQSLAPTPGNYDFTRADAAVAIAEDNGLRIRGHTLFWSRLNGLPTWLEAELAASENPVRLLEALMQAHAAIVVGRYAGRIAQWDVINEPLALLSGEFEPDNPFFNVLGEAYIDIGLRAAHAADPNATLFVNETSVEFLPAKFDSLIALAERLLARGVPLHGIGLQAHFIFLPPDREQLEAQLARVAALGLQVELTELDIALPLFANTPDPLAAQAQAYADVVAACLAVPACTGITTWGIDDDNSWLDSFELSAANAPNRPLLFAADGVPKPAYQSVLLTLRSAR
ncbi:MAG: endo-1,4-beta-xylanase [Halioglobus sp.]|nr:endo-1,4-beta-xylanase [Halioglobus sp.]